MDIVELDAAPPPDLQQALQDFEATFQAPFAPGRSFRVDYGADRTAFIRTLGEGRCLAAVKEGRVTGFLEMAAVDLLLPDGATRAAIFYSSIKVLPEARGTLTTGRLLQKSLEWARARSDLSYAVALDGTAVLPPAYTGRAGITALAETAGMAVVRVPIPRGGGTGADGGRFITTDAEGLAIYTGLARGRHAMPGGRPEARSDSPPVWMTHPDGLACARFEDRRKVRRLIADDGAELRPAYLSCFAFKDPRAAVDLIVAALRRAKALGFTALRFCLPPADLALLQATIGPLPIETGAGKIFATAPAKPGIPWIINGAEV